MTNPTKYKVLPGGQTCKKVNPYEHLINRDLPTLSAFKTHAEFEANNPILPLTEPMKEGKGFSGVEVWQWMPSNGDEWLDVEQQDYDKFNTFELFTKHCSPYRTQTRIAIQPIKEEKKVPKDPRGEVIGYLTFDNGDLKMNNIEEVSPLQAVDANKEVEDKAMEAGSKYSATFTTYSDFVKLELMLAFKAGAQWQQSQSVGTIVGFVLEYASEKAEFTIDKKTILGLKTEIIKELKK